MPSGRVFLPGCETDSATGPPPPTKQISPFLPTTCWPRPGGATSPSRSQFVGRRGHAPVILRQTVAEDGESPARVIGGGDFRVNGAFRFNTTGVWLEEYNPLGFWEQAANVS